MVVLLEMENTEVKIRVDTISPYPGDLSGLAPFFEVRRKPEVSEFLIRAPFMYSYLTQLPGKIIDYFGIASKVFLEVVTDPEVEEDKELLVSIQTNLEPAKAFTKLSQFDAEWWLSTPAYARKKICIDLDFK